MPTGGGFNIPKAKIKSKREIFDLVIRGGTSDSKELRLLLLRMLLIVSKY